MKKYLLLITTCLLTLAQGAWAQEPVSYVNRTWDGSKVVERIRRDRRALRLRDRRAVLIVRIKTSPGFLIDQPAVPDHCQLRAGKSVSMGKRVERVSLLPMLVTTRKMRA